MEKINSKPVALITGGSSFLGRAIALRLAEKGFNLVLHYQTSLHKTKKLALELKNLGTKVELIKSDLRRPEKIHSFFHKALKSLKRLDLLVNNASLFYPTPMEKGKVAEWKEIFGVNLFSPYFLAREAAPWLKKSKGSIINLSDIYGENPHLKNYSAYCISKAGLNTLTRIMAKELGPEIRVNSISPGAIFIPSSYSPNQKKDLVERSVLKRQGRPQDIAEAVYFLAVNQFITGQNLRVDGGRFL